MHTFWDPVTHLPVLPPHPLARLQPAALPGAILVSPLPPEVRVLRPASEGPLGDALDGGAHTAAGAERSESGTEGGGRGRLVPLSNARPTLPDDTPLLPPRPLLDLPPDSRALRRSPSAVQFNENKDNVEEVS